MVRGQSLLICVNLMMCTIEILILLVEFVIFDILLGVCLCVFVVLFHSSELVRKCPTLNFSPH